MVDWPTAGPAPGMQMAPAARLTGATWICTLLHAARTGSGTGRLRQRGTSRHRYSQVASGPVELAGIGVGVAARTNGKERRMILSILVTLVFVATLLFMLVRAFTGPVRHRHGRPVH